MDLFDFFMPEQAQAHHLRQIARHQARQSRPYSTGHELKDQVSELQQDVNFLTMLLAAIIRRLGETRTLSLADLQDLLAQVDQLDGIPNGGLDPGVLRGLVGVLRESEMETKKDQKPDGKPIHIKTSVLDRYRS